MTFLFTDLEGSTRLWQDNAAVMQAALARHDELIESLVEEREGTVVRPRGEGDSRFAVFPRASDAVAAACAIQRAFNAESWPTPTRLRVRIAMHTGEADLRLDDYYGTAVNRCARLRAIAHGGQTLVSGVTADLVRDALPEQVTLLDLGSHRLKDLAAPERVFQLLHPDLPTDFPLLNSLTALRHNLPIQLTSFIGREKEMVEVIHLIRGTRLLTITGAAGSGKTRLSLQAAAELVEDYPDGVWFVELAPVTEPSLVPQTMALEIGVGAESDKNILSVLVRALAGKNLLVVLDNCEHVIVACARLAEALLRACRNVTIMATSREPLDIAGETVWRVPSLSLPPDLRTQASLENMAKADAVSVFVERARTALPTFVLSDETAPAVSQLCRAVDGIPLALELAAPWVRALSIQQIVDRLADSLRLLAAGSRSAPPRHQTLRAAIEWSYGLLSEVEQQFFHRMSAFVGGWTLEAAEEVATPDGIDRRAALDLLRSLVDKSLVLADPRPGHAMRFRLLEILRQYGQERLEASGAAETIRSNHTDYFLALAEEAEQHLAAGPDLESWLERLNAEQGNLRVSLRWCAEHGDDERGLRLGGAVWRFWHLRGLLEEGREWLNLLLRMTGSSTRNAARAKVLNAAGALAIDEEDHAAAQALLEESRAIWDELGDSSRVGACLHNLAVIANARGDDPAAERLYEEALALVRDSGDRAREAITLNSLGWLLTERCDYARARDVSTKSVKICRELGDELSAVWFQMNLAWVNIQEGDPVAGRSLFVQNLVFLRDRDPKYGIPECLEGLAAAAASEGAAERALRLVASSTRLRKAIGYPLHQNQRKRISTWLDPLRRMLNVRTAAAASAEGEAMSLEEAVVYALSDTHSAPTASNKQVTTAKGASGPLTPREQEVAALLAKGHSNREIAVALVIATSTVERHVANILNKLGMGSRVEVALWAVENGLS